MNREQLMLLEQDTRNNDIFLNTKEVKDLLNKRKFKYQYLSGLIVLLNLVILYYSFNNLLDFKISVVVIMITMLVSASLLFDPLLIKTKELKNLFKTKYDLDIEYPENKKYIKVKEFKNISDLTINAVNSLNYENLDYAVLFFSERYLNVSKEEQLKIENNLNKIKEKIKEHKSMLANRKELLSSIVKESPDLGSLIDENSIHLSEEESKLTRNNLKKEQMIKMLEIEAAKRSKIFEINNSLEEYIEQVKIEEKKMKIKYENEKKLDSLKIIKI